MKKAIRMGGLVLTLSLLLAGCRANVAESPSPSPTLTEAPTPAASPDIVPEASPEVDVDRFEIVGEEASITVGTTKLRGAAYYAGDERTEGAMLFPLAEVAKALGWTVDEPDVSGPAQMKLTQAGAEDVTVSYTRPSDNANGEVTGVTAQKGGAAVDVAGDSFAFLDGQLYAPEAFIDKAVQEIDVVYDGKQQITVEAKA